MHTVFFIMFILFVTLQLALFQAGVVGLRREQREMTSPWLDDNPITITVTQSSTAVLPCSVDPRYTEQNKEKFSVVWVSPERTVISMADRRIINDMRISVERPFLRDWNLHIRNVSVTDAGEYMCQINTSPVKSKSVHLMVKVPPTIVDYTQPVEMSKMEGELVELFCNASGVPKPSVTWYRQNVWGIDGRERVGSNGEHLVIHNVTRMCADVYTCIADNGVPPATKQEFHVEVHYPPEIRLHNTRIGQEVGKETILECIISASPLRVTSWKNGGHTFGNDLKDKFEVNIYDYNGESSIYTIVLSLRIMRVEPSDYGNYTCEASNNYGRVVKTMELYEVRPRASPSLSTTTSSTTTTSKVWINPNHPHETHGGSRAPKPHQPNHHLGGPFSPDMLVKEGKSSANENGAPGRGVYGSTAGPSGQQGSGGEWPYQNVEPPEYGATGNGNTSFQMHYRLFICCLMSSLWGLLQNIV